MGGKGFALAVDVGSSAVRAAVVRPDGVIVAVARVGRPDSHAGVVFDPELLWQQFAAACTALERPLRAQVGVVAIAGHIGTVFLDGNARPLGPGRGWADTDGLELFARALGDDARRLLPRSGRPVVTGGAGAAALWLRAEKPREFDRVASMVAPKDFLVVRLTGSVATDHTSAAYTGLSRVGGRNWDGELLSATGLDAGLLPRQIAGTDVVDGLARRVAAELGLPPGIPVVAGGPDGSVGAAFVVGERSDVIADVAGTTDVLVGLIDDADSAPTEAIVNPYPLGGFSAGGATGMTGGALAQWTSLCGFTDTASAVAAVGARGRPVPGAGGLRVLTTLSGGRFPRWRPDLSGAVWGQRADHGPADFIQATAEGAAFVVREGIDVLDPHGVKTIALAGGAARSRLLAELRADILGRPVLLCSEPDVSLLGAALLAFRGAGFSVGGDFDVAARSAEIIAPDRSRAAAYTAVFAEWQRGLDVHTASR